MTAPSDGGAPASESSLTGAGDLPIPVAPYAVVAGRAHRVCPRQFGPHCYRPAHVRGDVLGVRNG